MVELKRSEILMKLSSSKDGIKRLSWKVKKFWAEKEVSV